MKILSWNIQSGLGCDNIRDIYRVAAYLKGQTADVICLQEVARYIPEYCPVKQSDQVAILCSALPEFTAVWGTGMRWWQKARPPQEFGNLTLVRSVLMDQRIHPLPRPAGDGSPQLPRVATEGTVPTSAGPLRIINTHIAYHNRKETEGQIAFVCRLQEQEVANRENPPARRTGSYADLFRTASAVLCGDLNLTPVDPCYSILKESHFSDGWRVCNPTAPHPATCGIYDQQTWSEGPHCRDYFWVSHDLTHLITDLHVDQQTDISDHQPLLLTLNLNLVSSFNGDAL